MYIDSFMFGGGFEIMFTLIFITVFGLIIFTIIRGIGEWNKNNQSPADRRASIVAERTHVQRHTHHNAGDITGAHGTHMTSSTSYYVTFQVESGDRMELSVKSSEYGMLAEGDSGRLTFQGTRFLGFER